MKHKREEHGLTFGPDNKLYAIGGFNGKQSLNTAERYDIKTNTWEEIASLNSSRRSLSTVALDDGIYAIGGYDGEKYLNTVEKYNIQKNEWTFVQSLNQPRCTMACVSSLNYNSIYVMGGYNGSPLSSVECYDAVHGTWSFVRPMKYKRFMHSASVIS